MGVLRYTPPLRAQPLQADNSFYEGTSDIDCNPIGRYGISPYQYWLLSAPTYGQLEGDLPANGDEGTMVYNPLNDFYGVDTYQFMVQDASPEQKIGTVTIRVYPTTDAAFYTRFRNAIGDTGASPAFSTSEIDDLYKDAIKSGADYITSVDAYAKRGAISQLLAQAAKRFNWAQFDYSQNESVVFDQLKKLYEMFDKEFKDIQATLATSRSAPAFQTATLNQPYSPRRTSFYDRNTRMPPRF